jgi:hypothetical protein
VFSNLESHTKTASTADVGGRAGIGLVTGPEKAARARDEKTAGGSSARSGSQPAGSMLVAKSQRSHPPGLSDLRR